MTRHKTSQDAFGAALAYLFFGICCGLALDICAKWLLQDYSLEQFVFLRSVFGLLTFLLIVRWYGGLRSLKTKRWGWHLLRTVLACTTMFGFFYGLSKMPLVNALTLAFTAPLIVTALSVPVLGEQVGWRRWVAVTVGFLGVLIVLRPGTGLLNPAAIGVLIAAAGYAGLALTARTLASTESPFSMSVYVILGPLLVSALVLPGKFVMPDLKDWGFYCVAGLCSAGAWVGIVGGYRRASPVVLAPFEYTALIGGAVAGFYIWNEVPDRFVVLGGFIIICSGLYIVYRETGAGFLSARYLRAITAGAAGVITRRFSRGSRADDDLTSPRDPPPPQ